MKWRRGAAAVCGAFVLWLAAVCAGSQDLRAAAQAVRPAAISQAPPPFRQAYVRTSKKIPAIISSNASHTDLLCQHLDIPVAFRDTFW